MDAALDTLILVIKHIWRAFSVSVWIFFALFTPIIVCCIVLNILSRQQENLLYRMGGWYGLLVTAWIGTPIHELSHLIAAIISGHRINEVKFFKPEPRTGNLGYVSHSYNPNSFYQSAIGNTLIAIAPFFGGSVVIYLMMYLLLPQFSLYAPEVPEVAHLTSNTILSWQGFLDFGKSTLVFFRHLALNIFTHSTLTSWKFYLFLFLMFGVANHLSPSRADFKSFWKPLSMIIVGMTLMNIVILPFTNVSTTMVDNASRYVLQFMPILYLSIFVSLLGLALTGALFLFIYPVKSGW